MRLPKNDFTRPGDILDSEGNYSITNSDISLSSEFLFNMLNFYKTQFLRSTIFVTDVTDENDSSSERNYFDCPVCSKSIIGSSLRSHIKFAHVKNAFSARDAARELAADAGKHDFVKGTVFKCKKCGEKFSSSEGIKLHIDKYANGDCCPESEPISKSFEQNAMSASVDKDCCSGSSQIPNPVKQNATSESADRDCFTGSSQIPNPTEQNVDWEFANRDSSQAFSQIAESIEQYSGHTSANENCPGTSHILDPIEAKDWCEPTHQSTNNSRCEITEGGYSEHYASNYVEETAFTCRFCFYACEHLDDMVDHYSIHELLRVCYPQDVVPAESLSRHVCPDCLKIFDDMDALIDHINLVYRRPYTCLTCHEFLLSDTSYDLHLEIHTSDLIKTYRDSRNLRQNDLLTNSTEDQDITKSTTKRKRKRSKKILDNQKSDKSTLFISVADSQSPQPLHLPYTQQLASTNVPSHQEDIIREESKECEKNLQEFTFVTASSIPQIESSSDQENTIREDYKKTSKESEKNLETFLSFEGATSPKAEDSPYFGQIVSTNVSSDQKDIIREESKESKLIHQDSSEKTSPLIPQIARSYSDESIIGGTSKESEKNSETLISIAGFSSSQTLQPPYTSQTVTENACYAQKNIISKETKRSGQNLQESIDATASSSIPQIIDLPNNQQVIFTYASSDQEDIREDSKESSTESESNLDDQKSIPSPPTPLFTTTTKMSLIENYDADVSAGASSDDQEVVQISACGAYVKRSKKIPDEQSSAFVPTGENPYRCVKCNITFEIVSDFVAHNLMHSIFMCLKCNKLFRLKSTFMKHLVEHTGRKPFACFDCWRSYETNNAFKIHEKHCPDRNRHA